MSNYNVVEEVVELPLNDVTVLEDRYRKDLGDLVSLAESIKERGQIQPVIISDKNILIAGERRYRALEMIQATLQPEDEPVKIKAIIRSHNEINAKITEIIENLDRKNFTWQEATLATDDLHKLLQSENPKWTGRDTAERAKLSSGTVYTDLGLAKAIREEPEKFKTCKTRDSALKLIKKEEIDGVMAEIKLRQTKTDYGKKAQNYVFNGDCRTLVEGLPAGIVDAVIMDPIYGIDINNIKKHKEGKLNIYEDDEEKYFTVLEQFIDKLPRVMNDNSALAMFCRVENFYWLHDKFTQLGFRCDAIPGIWLRGTGQTMQPNLYMARSYEVFLYGFRGEATMIRPGLSNVLQHSGIPPVYKDHPVQKPITLMEDIISRLCLPGHTILDGMCGSGTTGVAAIKKGCKPILFELGEDKYNVALGRIADVLNAKDAGKLDMVTDVK